MNFASPTRAFDEFLGDRHQWGKWRSHPDSAGDAYLIASVEKIVPTLKDADTAIRGAADRFAAILMTSLVTALGVLLLAIGMGEPGHEIDGPMAVVILGGLLTSMALNLLVLPTLALRYGRFRAEDEFQHLANV